MNYKEVLEKAKTCIGPYCKACPECNGKACRNQIPGPGSKGLGDTAIRNYDMWKKIRLNMDTLTEQKTLDMSVDMFGKKFSMPVFAGPAGAVKAHYGDKHNDYSYNEILVAACAKKNIAAFTGDGLNESVMIENLAVVKEAEGFAIPTVKPWNKDTVLEKFALVEQSGAFAVAMDIDAAGLPFLKNMNPPAGSKSVEEMKEIIDGCKVPFIVKGIMTAKAALKAREAGASAIVVSNHGGRVLDQCLSTAEVLEEIVQVSGDMIVLVDGGIRSGTDVFKALALGADGVLICRPFVTAVYGGAEEGVNLYIEKIKSELESAMQMCGAYSLEDISRDMVTVKF